MQDSSFEPESETAVEKRARLRKMRILGNSENRMKLIFEGQKNEPTSLLSCSQTADSIQNSSSICDKADNYSEYPVFKFKYEENCSHFEPDSSSGRESEVLPRKVSMISSPIDYKTLQRSQEHHARVNNYLNTFQANIATPTIVLVIILSIISSFVELNIPTVFSTFQAIKCAIKLQLDVKKGNLVKELITFLFVYAMVQALLFMLR